MFENFFKNNKIETAKQAIEKDPDNIIKLNILADLYIENKFHYNAIKVLEKILVLDENYLPAMNKLGKSYIKTGKYLQAYKILKNLYTRLPDNTEVKILLLSLKNASCDNESKAEILQGLSEIDNSFEIREMLAEAYYISGQFCKSANLYEDLLIIEEKPKYYNQLITIYYKTEKWLQAAKILEKLMLTDMFQVSHSKILAEVYAKQGCFEEAKGIYELLINSDNKNSELYKEKIAEIHLLENNPDKALEISNNVIENNQYSDSAKFLQVQALLEKKDYKKAIEVLKEFYFDPIDKITEEKIIKQIVEISILYSQQLREKKDYAGAIDVLMPALRYDENNKNIFLELSQISTDIKDFSAAKEYKKIAENL